MFQFIREQNIIVESGVPNQFVGSKIISQPEDKNFILKTEE